MRPYSLVEFLVRAKGARIDLSGSTVPPLSMADLGIEAGGLDLGYTPPLGGDDLRSGIAELYGVDASQVIVTMGAHEANNVAFLTALRGGPALLERPYFEPLRNMPEAFGSRVDTVDGARFADALAGGGYALAVLSNPNNPGERVHDPRPVLEAAEDTGAFALFDEIYRPFVRGMGSAMEHARERAMVSCSLSKVAGLGGIRLGWLVVTPDLADEVARVKMNLNPTNTSVGEIAAMQCIMMYDRVTERARRITAEGRAVLREEVSSLRIPGGELPFAYCLYSEGPPSAEAAETLLADHGICLLPGEFFGGSKAFRISTGRPTQEGYRALDDALVAMGIGP